jgi:hypothetical protein
MIQARPIAPVVTELTVILGVLVFAVPSLPVSYKTPVEDIKLTAHA